MPWQVSSAAKQRKKFVEEMERGEFGMALLCRRYGISRPTGYKWRERYGEAGAEGLEDRSRVPKTFPRAISADVEEQILQLRRSHSHWGPRKLRAWLERKKPGRKWPVASTIGALLKREGLVVPRRKRRRAPPYTEPLGHADGPNRVWCADMKGWFRTGDGERCDPLTITDACTRYLLRCQVVKEADTEHVRAVFEAAFREYGLPVAIRTDNGAPFASRALGGLSRLSVWWIKLGIAPERIRPGKPQENGRHERMHRTLKAETANPPASNRRRQQEAFDRFRREYNEERPHEALGQETPASVYQPSWRLYPDRLPGIGYPAAFEVRKVQQHGQVQWKNQEVFVSEVLAGESVGFELIAEGLWGVYFAARQIGIFDARRLKIRPNRAGEVRP